MTYDDAGMAVYRPAPPRRFALTLAVALALHATTFALQVDLPDVGGQARNLAVRLMAGAPAADTPPPATPPPRAAAPPPRSATPARPVPAATPAASAVVPAPPAVDAASDTPATGDTPPPATVVEARVDTRYQDNPKPGYPPMSRRLGEEGTVLLRIEVNAGGEATGVSIERSCGFARLDDAARRAVASWRFLPARRGDVAVASSVLVPVTFALGRGAQ